MSTFYVARRVQDKALNAQYAFHVWNVYDLYT